MHSVRTKILAITLVFFAFPAIAFVLYSMATTTNYKRQRLESIEETVAFETEKINKTIAVIEFSAVSLSRDGLLLYISQSQDIGETSALEYLRCFPISIGSGFWFEPYMYKDDMLRYGVYAYFDKEKGEVRLDEFDISEYDYHSQDWYRQIIDSVKSPYQVKWTRPYFDDTSFCLVITAGAGIFNQNGDLIGMSHVDWEIDGVIDELSSIKPTENSFILLCAPELDTVISNTYAGGINDTSLKNIPWDINADSFVLEGTRYLPFRRIMDNGWLLSVQIPENEIFAEVENRNNRFSLIIVFSSVVLLCLAYVLISYLFNTPMKRLISDVTQLSLGNLDVRVKITSKDELGLLAQAFNQMTLDLKKSIEAYTRVFTEKERISAEISVAAELQTSMLPRDFPAFPGRNEFNIYASMFPAKVVGGDFYDFYFLSENILAVIIADVSGKGIPAALYMVIAKSLIKNISLCRNEVCNGKNPAGIFETVNNMLCTNNEKGMFATAFMGFYNTANGKFTYVNAGHNPPMLKKSGKEYEFLKTNPCLVLGCQKDITAYRDEEITLEPGDSLFLYTDGITEAMNINRELFTEQRLEGIMKKYKDDPPKILLSAVKQEVDRYSGEAEQADDITMLALKINRYSNQVDNDNPDELTELEPLEESA